MANKCLLVVLVLAVIARVGFSTGFVLVESTLVFLSFGYAALFRRQLASVTDMLDFLNQSLCRASSYSCSKTTTAMLLGVAGRVRSDVLCAIGIQCRGSGPYSRGRCRTRLDIDSDVGRASSWSGRRRNSVQMHNRQLRLMNGR